MSNRNNRKESNKGPLSKEQSSKGIKSQSGGGAQRQNQEEKKSQAQNNDGWDNMFSKTTQPKKTQQPKADLSLNKAQSQMYSNMDDAIVSVDESSQPSSDTSLRKNHSEIQKNSFQRNDQNKDLIFAGFGGSGNQKSRGGNPKKAERELTKTSWVGKQGKKETLGDLENSTPFDQFANRNTTYKESLYNTSYNVKNLSKQQVQYAAKIEREINNADSKGNVHLAEERNQIQLRDNDNEEIKYSGVLRAPKLKNAKKFSGFKTFKNKKMELQNNFKQSYSGEQLKSESVVILNPVKWDELMKEYQTKSPAAGPEWENAIQKPSGQQNQYQYQQKQSYQNQQQKQNHHYNNNYQSNGFQTNNQDYQGGNSYHNQNFKPRYHNQNNLNHGQQQNNYQGNQYQQVYQGNQHNLQGSNQNSNYHHQTNHSYNQTPKPYNNALSAPPYTPQAMTTTQPGGTSHQTSVPEQRAPASFEQNQGKNNQFSNQSMNLQTSSFTPTMAQNSQPWKPPSSNPPSVQGQTMSTNAQSFTMQAQAKPFVPNFKK